MNEIYFYPKNHVRRFGTGTKTVKTRTQCYFSPTCLGSVPLENCNNLQRILFRLLELFAIFGNKKSIRVPSSCRRIKAPTLVLLSKKISWRNSRSAVESANKRTLLLFHRHHCQVQLARAFLQAARRSCIP